MTITKRLICGLALAAVASVPLYATIVLAARHPGNFTFTVAGTPVPITIAGATFVQFSGSGRHAIAFSAECETTGAWLSIEILVDGVALAPTAGSSDAFCTDGKTAEGLDGWVTASTTVATPTLASGVHTVQVRGTVVANGGTSDTGWLSDTSLVVWK